MARARPRAVGRLLLALLLAAGSGRAQESAPLTSVAAIRGLSREEAAQALPARIRGVVTTVFGRADGLIVDDGTGLYIANYASRSAGLTLQQPAKIAVGDMVEVQGRTAPGHYAPVILPEVIRVVGRSPLPAPQVVSLGALLTGRFDCQRVALRGVVQAVSAGTEGRREVQWLDLATEHGHVSVQVAAERPLTEAEVLDAEVLVTGSCTPHFNTRGELMGVCVQANSAAEVVVEVAAPPDPFAAPAVALGRLLPFSPAGHWRHRRRVAGTVSLSQPGEFFYLQEGARGIRVATRQTDALVPGDYVEAAGFPELTRHFAELRESVFRRLAPGPAPVAVATTRDAILGLKGATMTKGVEDFDGRLVALDGVVARVEPLAGGGQVLYLESGGGLVPVELGAGREATRLRTLRPESAVRVTGVCVLSFEPLDHLRTTPRPLSFRLLLRAAGDVAVVRAAPWWTPRRLWTALGVTGAVLIGALGWATALRRQVALRTEQLAREMRRRRDAHLEFEAELRERNRLAADLHDLLEQDLAAVGYQLEAERALRDDDPAQAREHLEMADQFLVHSRADVHRSVWNLRAGLLAGRSLAEALRTTAERLAGGRGVECRLACEVDPPAPAPLPTFISGNLLLFAQEAISNALKHAAPTRLDVRLIHDAAGVTLTIGDNGAGFIPGAAPGPDDGHFGLNGMRERLKRLGGTLHIESTPAGGTRLSAQVSAAEIEAARVVSEVG